MAERIAQEHTPLSTCRQGRLAIESPLGPMPNQGPQARLSPLTKAWTQGADSLSVLGTVPDTWSLERDIYTLSN